MPANTPQVEDIFDDAIRCEPGKDREAYLDKACGKDHSLRQRVERLLRAADQAGSFLESPAAEASPTVDFCVTEKSGDSIGPYKLLQQIGEGGMGVVYMAEQKEPVKRRIALKIIKPGMDTRQVIARFEAERQALAMMDHPNIAKVLDAGQTDSGRPYFVMELVNGLPVTEYCDEQHLTPKERLELFVPICQAVQHAHQKGIIHRDLKPSNILVALYDGQAVPKIIDFGVAKATSQTLTEKTMFTQLGQVVGTLEYMSPEQAERNQLDIDTRSDIYSLGVVLYELLTGETPFDRERLRLAAFDEMLRIIREEEPSKPSTRVSSSQSLPSIAANRRIEPAKLGSMIRGELDWIVMKAMEKDRKRRYETASKFAEDVEHHLNNETVEACPPSVAYRFRKFTRRNRVLLLTGSGMVVALLLGTGLATWQAIRATRAEDAAQRQAHRADQEWKRADSEAKRATAEAERAHRELVRTEEATELASRQAELTRRQRDLTFQNLYVAQIRLAHLDWKAGNLYRMRSALDAFRPQLDRPDVRGWEWFYLKSLLAKESNVYEPQLGGINSVSWSSNGQLVAIGGRTGAMVYDPFSQQVVRSMPGHTHAAWSPNGLRLATATKEKGKNYVHVWTADSWQTTDTLASGGPVNVIAWSPDSSSLAWTTGLQFSFWREGQKEPQPLRQPTKKGFQLLAAAWGANSRLLMMAGKFPSTVCYWDTDDNKLVRSFDAGAVRGVTHLALHPDGLRFVSGTIDGELGIREIQSGNLIRRFRAHNGQVLACDWSNDGKHIVSCGEDNLVRIFDVDTSQQVNQFPGHDAVVQSIDWSPTVELIVSGSADGTIRFWRPEESRDSLQVLGRGAVAWSPDGRHVVSNDAHSHYDDASYSILDSRTGETIRSLESPKSRRTILVFAWSPDGQMVGGADNGGAAYIWNAGTGQLVHSLLRAHLLDEADDGEARCINWAPDGNMFSTCGQDGLVKIWATSSGTLLHTFADHDARLGSVCWSPCGRWLASADWRRSIKIRRTDDWQVEWEIDQQLDGAKAGGNSTIAWSPDSKQLATVGESGEIAIWNLSEGQKTLKVRSIEAHTSVIRCVAWNPRGSRIASGSEDCTVKIWDAKTGRELMSLDGHNRMVWSVAWSPDGQRLASTGDHSSLISKMRIWDATTSLYTEKPGR